MANLIVDADKMTEANAYLDDAIVKIDTLLRKYAFVTRIQLAREARLELERASRLLHGQLNGNTKSDSTRNVSEEHSDIGERNDDISEGNDVNDETDDGTDETEEQGD